MTGRCPIHIRARGPADCVPAVAAFLSGASYAVLRRRLRASPVFCAGRGVPLTVAGPVVAWLTGHVVDDGDALAWRPLTWRAIQASLVAVRGAAGPQRWSAWAGLVVQETATSVAAHMVAIHRRSGVVMDPDATQFHPFRRWRMLTSWGGFCHVFLYRDSGVPPCVGALRTAPTYGEVRATDVAVLHARSAPATPPGRQARTDSDSPRCG